MRLSTLLLLALAACRPGVPSTPAPEPPAAVSLAAGTTRYSLVEHRHVAQTIQEQPILSETTARLVLSLSLTPGDGGFAATALLESVAVEGDTGGLAAASAAGARMTGHLGPAGARFARTGDTTPHELLDQLVLRLHDLLPALPAGGARPGATWYDTAVVTGRTAAIPVTLTSQAMNQAASWDRLDGIPVLSITRAATYTLDGEGNPTGSRIVLRGQGIQHTQYFVDTAGAVHHGVRADTLRAEIEDGATGLVIPVMQTRADTLRRATQ